MDFRYSKTLILVWISLFLASAQAAGPADCGPGILSQLDNALDERPLSGPSLADPKRVQEDFATFRKITEADNKVFNDLAKKANAGEPTEAKLFADVEMAVAKQANDKFVNNKDLVTGLSNLHKEILWKNISQDPDLAKQIVGKYSDFKSVRFAFRENTPAIEAKLKKALTEANIQYEAALEELATKLKWEEKARGIAKNRRDWFHGGIGGSPDEAGLAARQSRSLKNEAGFSEMRSFKEVSPRLEKSAQEFQRVQRWAEERFKNVDGMLTDAGGGRKILSPEAIEAYKKVTPLEDTRDAFVAAVQKDFKARFGVDLKRQQVESLQKYLDITDQFSPGIFVEKRVEINLGLRDKGIISGDFKGQNARNFHETMQALVSTEGRNFAERVKAVRKGEDRATYALNQKKEVFKKSVEKVFGKVDPEWEKHVFFTGDDGIYLPKNALSRIKEEEFMDVWLQSSKADDLRQTFIASRYGDSQTLIPTDLRSEFVVAAESIEKKMRGALIQKVPREDLNGVQFAIRYQPQEAAGAKPLVDVYIRPNVGKSVPKQVTAAVKEYLSNNKFDVKFVDAKAVGRSVASAEREIPALSRSFDDYVPDVSDAMHAEWQRNSRISGLTERYKAVDSPAGLVRTSPDSPLQGQLEKLGVSPERQQWYREKVYAAADAGRKSPIAERRVYTGGRESFHSTGGAPINRVDYNRIAKFPENQTVLEEDILNMPNRHLVGATNRRENIEGAKAALNAGKKHLDDIAAGKPARQSLEQALEDVHSEWLRRNSYAAADPKYAGEWKNLSPKMKIADLDPLEEALKLQAKATNPAEAARSMAAVKSLRRELESERNFLALKENPRVAPHIPRLNAAIGTEAADDLFWVASHANADVREALIEKLKRVKAKDAEKIRTELRKSLACPVRK